MSKITHTHDLCFLDFEFSKSNHKKLNLVSCSYRVNNKPVENVWLQKPSDNPKAFFFPHALHGAKYLKARFEKLRDAGYTFVAYAAAAEARCFLALGIDPNTCRWVDLYFEHRLLTHTYHKFKYGTYFKGTGMPKKSVPPTYDPRKNKFLDNNAVGMGYTAAVAVHFNEYIDSDHKDAMRSLILECKKDYTEQEQNDIMEYCASDIKWLPDLLSSQNKEVAFATRLSPEKVFQTQKIRGAFAASLAKMEEEGFPLRVEAIKNLRRNFSFAKDTLIMESQKAYPFYHSKKKKKSDFLGEWTFTHNSFEKFIDGCDDITTHPNPDRIKADYVAYCKREGKEPSVHILEKKSFKNWPLSQKSFKYKTDEATLDKYIGIPAIKALKDTKKAIGQLQWFQYPKKEEGTDFFDNVGPDDKLRAFLGGYGTLTGRNAPRAKTFVLAMSSWLRCLIQPSGGESIIAIDYASQEFIIAAVMSQDKAMLEAYASGDPYLYFAVRAGAVTPEDAEWWKSEKKSFADDENHVCSNPEKFAEISAIRDLFKATTLGLQYGMGAASLAIKLTADCGRLVTEFEATKLINLHKRTYPTYWRWLDHQERQYKNKKCLILKDGWALLANQDNGLSVKNFPVQGTGGVIMRRAVHLAHKEGVRILAPLHDAIYAIYDNKTQADHPEILSRCMQTAVEDVLGKGVIIRQDRDIHDHNHVWVEGKGKKFYDMLHQYLEHMETTEDTVKNLDEGLFAPV